jgi:long-chain acyl-CoA synthetase
MLYTGGTTGRSKGVRLSHRNIVANAQQNGFALGITYGDVWLHAAPMFHSADLIGNPPTLMGGGHVYLPQFSGPAFLAAVERHRPSATVLPPTMLRMVMDDPAFADHDVSSLRLLYYGSSPMAAGWIRDAIERFPEARIIQGYGLTETAPILTVLDDASHRAAIASGDITRLASAGRPVPDVWIRIVDGEAHDVAPGETGEVVVRGPNVMNGYHGLAAESAAALRDGWLHTGDVGRMDDDGYLYLLDRKKDVVITGGENVYTTEVEAALHGHPDVLEAAVIGIPDEHMGEALMAVIQPRDGARIDRAALIEYCRPLIGGYKIPRHYAFVEALPKNAMGKTLKTVLRKTYG